MNTTSFNPLIVRIPNLNIYETPIVEFHRPRGKKTYKMSNRNFHRLWEAAGLRITSETATILLPKRISDRLAYTPPLFRLTHE